VVLDNSKCSLNMRNVRLNIEQVLTLHGDGHRYSDTFTLASDTEAGVPARSSEPAQRNFDLDLKTIRYVIPAFRKKKGVEKPLSAEDRFMLENMAPRCHGSKVSNEYFLTVRCAYDGCTCCSALPVAKVPITIVPVINPQVWGY
jgi:hypothetical protein